MWAVLDEETYVTRLDPRYHYPCCFQIDPSHLCYVLQEIFDLKHRKQIDIENIYGTGYDKRYLMFVIIKI